MNHEILSKSSLDSWYNHSFSLNVNMTDDFFNKINSNIKFYSFWLDCLNKFRNADWGDITKEDWKLNNSALKKQTYQFTAIYKNQNYGNVIIQSDFKTATVSFCKGSQKN